jgi:hypothetical protein
VRDAVVSKVVRKLLKKGELPAGWILHWWFGSGPPSMVAPLLLETLVISIAGGKH